MMINASRTAGLGLPLQAGSLDNSENQTGNRTRSYGSRRLRGTAREPPATPLVRWAVRAKPRRAAD